MEELSLILWPMKLKYTFSSAETKRFKNKFLSKSACEIPISPLKSKGLNPAFDVTPAELISALVTEKGVYEISNGITPGSKLANA